MTPDTFRWHDCRSPDEMEAFYRSIIEPMREAARPLGYALTVHGTLRRDLDVVAVPWIDGATDSPDALAATIQMAAIGIRNARYNWEQKPGRRVATCFPVCWAEWDGSHEILSLGHVDLSVVRP
jgi:hypothetical protein